MSVGANVVPHFLKAKTREMLQRKMALTTARRGTYIKYRIVYAEGEWTAWYDSEMKTFTNNMEIVKNGISKK